MLNAQKMKQRIAQVLAGNMPTLNKCREIANGFRADGALRPLPKSTKPGRLFAAKTVNQRGELYIYEQIGLDCWTGSGVTAKGVAEALDSLKGASALDVFINSEGGDAFEGLAIYEQIRRFNAPEKVCYVDGIAASAASVIAMAGDRVVMAPAGTQMMHCGWSMALGNADDMRAYADILDLLDGNLATVYSQKSGKTKDECLALMKGDGAQDGTWMNPEQAVDLGFADEIARADEGDNPDEGDDQMAAAATAAMKVANVTQERLRAARASAQIASMETRNKTSPGQPGSTRSAQSARK